ncbi:MAG TPA: hypothetical protein VJ623_04905 [Holophagaceae bacterium]|nr:hypothetical protein [Holophagaceae bacterium]
MELVYANLGTLSGLSTLLLAVGLTFGLRPWPALPWVRPWLASYWVSALTLLSLSLPLAWPVLRLAPLDLRTFAVLNSGFFLAAGLQGLGWLRLRGMKAPLPLAMLPMATYLGLFFTTGAEGDARIRLVLFSSLQALLHGAMAAVVPGGLRRVAPRLGQVVSGLLTLHALFYVGRTALALLLPAEGDFSVSVAIAVLEGLIFNLGIAYFQWVVLTEGESA